MRTIGICGPSGSGKTSLAKMLAKELDANLVLNGELPLIDNLERIKAALQ